MNPSHGFEPFKMKDIQAPVGYDADIRIEHGPMVAQLVNIRKVT